MAHGNLTETPLMGRELLERDICPGESFRLLAEVISATSPLVRFGEIFAAEAIQNFVENRRKMS